MRETNLQLLLSEFIHYCNDLGDDALFIVEGKRDTEALRILGLKGTIIEKGQKSINELTDSVFQAPNIVILTDFDKKGKHLRNVIKKEIQHRKGHGRIDNIARQLLFKVCRGNRISEIEDISRLES